MNRAEMKNKLAEIYDAVTNEDCVYAKSLLMDLIGELSNEEEEGDING